MSRAAAEIYTTGSLSGIVDKRALFQESFLSPVCRVGVTEINENASVLNPTCDSFAFVGPQELYCTFSDRLLHFVPTDEDWLSFRSSGISNPPLYQLLRASVLLFAVQKEEALTAEKVVLKFREIFNSCDALPKTVPVIILAVGWTETDLGEMQRGLDTHSLLRIFKILHFPTLTGDVSLLDSISKLIFLSSSRIVSHSAEDTSQTILVHKGRISLDLWTPGRHSNGQLVINLRQVPSQLSSTSFKRILNELTGKCSREGQIYSLSLRHCDLNDSQWKGLLEALPKALGRGLTHLQFSGCPLGDKRVSELVNLISSCPDSLMFLILTQVGCDAGGASSIGHYLSKKTCLLRAVDLSDNLLGKTGATEVLRGLTVNHSVCFLRLFNTGMTTT